MSNSDGQLVIHQVLEVADDVGVVESECVSDFVPDNRQQVVLIGGDVGE